MTVARDLLEQAVLLANKEPRRPKQASLRRAISTAYYALFHLLVSDSTETLVPSSVKGLRVLVRRAFNHVQVKGACKDFIEANAAKNKDPNAQTSLPAPLKEMLVFPLDPDFASVLSTFVELHEARARADYDFSEPFDKADVLVKIGDVKEAFQFWSTHRKTTNAIAFQACMAFRKDWAKS